MGELKDARGREGKKLVVVLMERVTRLRELAVQAEPLVPAVVKRQQQRFLERWTEALEATGAAQTISHEALQERALNEAAAYSIRIDVAEELARLRSHLDEIARLLKAGGEVGKRLDFLIQELLREANTLGSKASALELTNISVEMKVAIEQLREQVQNIEYRSWGWRAGSQDLHSISELPRPPAWRDLLVLRDIRHRCVGAPPPALRIA